MCLWLRSDQPDPLLDRDGDGDRARRGARLPRLRAASAGWRMSAKLHVTAVTLRAGQPMLMSTTQAPASAAIAAARASTSGSLHSTTCTAKRRPPKLGHMRRTTRSAPRVSASADRRIGEGQGRAMLLADGAEGQVSHRLHGREQGARADSYGADTHREGKTIARPRGATPALLW